MNFFTKRLKTLRTFIILGISVVIIAYCYKQFSRSAVLTSNTVVTEDMKTVETTEDLNTALISSSVEKQIMQLLQEALETQQASEKKFEDQTSQLKLEDAFEIENLISLDKINKNYQQLKLYEALLAAREKEYTDTMQRYQIKIDALVNTQPSKLQTALKDLEDTVIQTSLSKQFFQNEKDFIEISKEILDFMRAKIINHDFVFQKGDILFKNPNDLKAMESLFTNYSMIAENAKNIQEQLAEKNMEDIEKFKEVFEELQG